MQNKYAVYEEALAEELIPAMGCTEPIAIAYCAAVCREQLGAFPEQIEIWVSRNIIKNVKSVVVPNTNKMKGIEVACAAGVVAAHSERQLEVLAYINQEEKAEIKALAESGKINIHVSAWYPAPSGYTGKNRIFSIFAFSWQQAAIMPR